jgi:hypothetical protein
METLKKTWRWWVDLMINYESDIDFIIRMQKEEKLLQARQKSN